MSVLTVSTPFNIDLEFRVAPFHKRLFAWFLDILLIFVYVYLVMRFVVQPLNLMDSLGQTVSILLVGIPAYCYHLLMEMFMNGQSLGKMVMGIKVMDLSGNEAGTSQYLLRWLFRLFDMGITMGAGAVLSVALSKYSQRIGDMVAGTVVIDKRFRTSLTETIYLEIPVEDYQPVFPEVMQLSDRDINGIRNLLDTKGMNRDTERYMEQVAERIREVLKIDTDLEPRALLQQLLKDYNFITANK